MRHSRREDARLDEVKAVLRRLQKITAAPHSPDLSEADRPLRAPRRMVVAATLATAAALLIAVAAFALIGLYRPAIVSRQHAPPVAAALGRTEPDLQPVLVPEGPAIPRSETLAAENGLDAALGLLNTGRVLAARKQLLGLVSEDAVDVAWALARSYDPNFLGTLAAADASPDIEEATRWYRVWHAAAVKQGLVGETVSLERIIGSMR